MDHKLDINKPGSRTDARIVRSRAALRDALVALMTEASFEEITIARLTERAGVGYATFFRHYPDKEALLLDIADALTAEMAARLAPLVAAGDARGAAQALVERVEADRPLFRALLIGAGDPLRRTMGDRAIRFSLGLGLTAPSPLPRDLAVRHMVSAAITVLAWWLEEDRALSPDALVDMLRRLVIEPVQ